MKKLEEEINQKHFKSEHQKLMINLVFTHSWLAQKMKAFFEEADLTPQQYNVLRILRGSKEPLSTLQIRNRMLDKMSDASRIVDRLIVKGLVTKSISQLDKRLVEVEISKKGLRLLEKLDPIIDEQEKNICGLSEKEASAMNKLLDKFRDV
jgi:DNA-binding MarR family transcriptional regulator